VYGAEEGGFNPSETRFYRNAAVKKKAAAAASAAQQAHEAKQGCFGVQTLSTVLILERRCAVLPGLRWGRFAGKLLQVSSPSMLKNACCQLCDVCLTDPLPMKSFKTEHPKARHAVARLLLLPGHPSMSHQPYQLQVPG